MAHLPARPDEAPGRFSILLSVADAGKPAVGAGAWQALEQIAIRWDHLIT
jgi:hypothetical protein